MTLKRWMRVRAGSTSPEQADLIAEALVAGGAAAVEMQSDCVITYLADIDTADAETTAAGLLATLLDATGENVAIQWDWLDDEDWTREWRRGLDARKVGNHFIVTPTWIEPAAGPGDIVITIDPKMAFGTGEHGTTRGMLRLMERAVQPGDVVLDVGAGSAILAIAAALMGAASADAVESDPDAIDNATENIERNGVALQVTLSCELVDDAYLRARPAHYDVIVANVLSGVLKPLLNGFRDSLKPNGFLMLSGILREEADGMIAAAAAAGFAVVAEDREDEWWSALLQPQAPETP